jgi:carboxypeptidase Taq
MAHEIFTSQETGRLLEDLRPLETSLPYESYEASLIRVARREYERRVRVPAEFVARASEAQSLSYNTWVGARPASDYQAVAPWLERILDLSREYASYMPGSTSGGADRPGHMADALIDQTDPGMSAVEIRRVFAELRKELVPIVASITSYPPADDACLKQYFAPQDQLAFGMSIAPQLGYDLTRGRQDLTAHPFMTHFSIDDVRITTRVKERDFTEAFFGVLHEAGHAMYGQGHDPALERTLLAEGASSGIHESQSRLWENLVGRSRGFWNHFHPKLRAAFPAQFGALPFDVFYRAINKVERSLIRTDADEVTYNLHIMLRFDFELDLLDDRLHVRELPDAWNARVEQDLGIAPPDHSSGVMQDVHWFSGWIGGAFQGYALGNILSAQFFDAAVRAHPAIPAEIERGEFSTLLEWLRQNIYRHGSKFLPDELVRRATGQSLNVQPYIAYLRAKYGELYPL